MSAQLRETATGTVFELSDFTLIGRSEGVGVRLVDAGISRQHATIRREGDHYWLIDLGSANGSYVNGVALTKARALAHGDSLRFADSVLTFTHVTADAGYLDPSGNRTTISQIPSTPFATETMTLLVADLKDFTKLGTLLGPDEIAVLLGEWYADCRRILRDFGASIDKFIGDCVFAYWYGGSVQTRMKALRAAQCLREVERLAETPARVRLRSEHGLALDCRVGLHVGSVALGTMGKDVVTALGDAVNMTFRIETLTRVADRPALASKAFASGLDDTDLLFETCGRHNVKGYESAIEVFSPRQVS